MRTRFALAAAVVVAASFGAGASAEPPTRLDGRHRDISFTGHLEGASAYGPFYPVRGLALDRTCVGNGCDERELSVVLPARSRARLDWSVVAPATGPGVSLRIFDEDGADVTAISGGSVDTPSPTTGTYGSVRSIRPGRYTVRVSLMAGVTDYTARLRLFLY